MATLAELKKGQKARILALDESVHAAPALLLRRLAQLGFTRGVGVEILHEGFPRRDPISVRVGQHTVALRRKEAGYVAVELVA
jgi:ferrous iron transport protein A